VKIQLDSGSAVPESVILMTKIMD